MFLPNFTCKTKIGITNKWETTNITAHLDQSNYVPSQYDLTVLIRLFQALMRAVHSLVLARAFLGANPLDLTPVPHPRFPSAGSHHILSTSGDALRT
jgi:hypothetical protein